MTMSSFNRQAWQWLGDELDRWSTAEIRARFWWRDDDAVTVSAALEKLAALSTNYRIPVSLAVIPAALKPDLIDYIPDKSLLSVLQHGFAHKSHAARGQRKLELGGMRPVAGIIADLEKGYLMLERSFADRFIPVLVPPWNRIDGKVVSRLSEIGFIGISTVKARRAALPVSGLLQVNTHLDPINWRQDGDFVGTYPAIAILMQHLIAKRTGYRDPDEPSGILTHHLSQNPATWRFTEDLLQFLSQHPAVDFVDARSIWN